MMWVIDASVALRWFIVDEAHPHAEAVLERLVSRPETFAVPELFCFEVFSVLCRVHPRGWEAFVIAMMPILEGGMLRHAMTRDLAEEAQRFINLGLTGYDASYVALARRLEGMWLTFDAKAHGAISTEGLSWDLGQGMPPAWE